MPWWAIVLLVLAGVAIGAIGVYLLLIYLIMKDFL